MKFLFEKHKANYDQQVQKWYTVVDLMHTDPVNGVFNIIAKFKTNQKQMMYRYLRRKILGDIMITPSYYGFKVAGKPVLIENWRNKLAVIITEKPVPSIGEFVTEDEAKFGDAVWTCLSSLVRKPDEPVDSTPKEDAKWITVIDLKTLECLANMKSSLDFTSKFLDRLKRRRLGLEHYNVDTKVFKKNGKFITIENFDNSYIVITTPLTIRLSCNVNSVFDTSVLNGMKPIGGKLNAEEYVNYLSNLAQEQMI